MQSLEDGFSSCSKHVLTLCACVWGEARMPQVRRPTRLGGMQATVATVTMSCSASSFNISLVTISSSSLASSVRAFSLSAAITASIAASSTAATPGAVPSLAPAPPPAPVASLPPNAAFARRTSTSAASSAPVSTSSAVGARCRFTGRGDPPTSVAGRVLLPPGDLAVVAVATRAGEEVEEGAEERDAGRPALPIRCCRRTRPPGVRRARLLRGPPSEEGVEPLAVPAAALAARLRLAALEALVPMLHPFV